MYVAADKVDDRARSILWNNERTRLANAQRKRDRYHAISANRWTDISVILLLIDVPDNSIHDTRVSQ